MKRIILSILLIGIVLVSGCKLYKPDLEKIAKDWEEIGYMKGISRGVEIAEENSPKCIWETWTEQDRTCYHILNGETKYITAYLICEQQGDGDYERIKAILEE